MQSGRNVLGRARAGATTSNCLFQNCSIESGINIDNDKIMPLFLAL